MTTLATAAGINKKRFTPIVVCPKEGMLVEELAKSNVPVVIIDRPRFYSLTARLGKWLVPNPFAILFTILAMVRASIGMVRFLRRQTDLIVTKGLLAHLYGGLAGALARKQCIWHVQEVAKGRLYVRLLNILARRWARFIVVDAHAVGQQFASDLHAARRVHLIYNGVDTRRFSPNGPLLDLAILPTGAGRPLLIGQLGRIVPLKGQHILIEAFAQLSNIKQNTQLVFVGTPMFGSDHYLSTLKNLVCRYNLSGRVHFLGFITNVPELLRAVDIFVHPSVEPDSPVSILEAMAAGKPIIASRMPGIVDLLSDGLEGYLVTPGDARALAQKLNFLIEHKEKRKQLAHAARGAAEQRYDQRLFIRRFEQVLSEAVET